MNQNNVPAPLFGLCMGIVVVAVVREHGENVLLVLQHLFVRFLWVSAIVLAALGVLFLIWKFVCWIARKCKNIYRWFRLVEDNIYQFADQIEDHASALKYCRNSLDSNRSSISNLFDLIEELNDFTGLKDHKLAQKKIKEAVEEVTPVDFEEL